MQKWIDEFRETGSDLRREKSMIEILLSLHQTEPEYYTDEYIKSPMLVRYIGSFTLNDY